MSFSVTGQHVVVMGAARSGLAAAELLVRRGARVTLTDVKTAIDGGDDLVEHGVTLELGGHRQRRSLRADLIVVSPGVKLDQPVLDRGARCRDPGDGRARAGVALAARASHRRHRHEGQVDDDDADGTDAGAVGVSRAGRREHRRAVERAGGRLDHRHAPRRGGQQLPAADDRYVPPVDRGAPELLARPPGSARVDRGIRGGESGDLPAADRLRLGGGERRRRAGASGWPRRAAPDACATGSRSPATGSPWPTA